MKFDNIKLNDSGLFVSADNTLRHLRNNGIETVSQLIAIVDINDLDLGLRSREETKHALEAVIGLARYKYLGITMDATKYLDDFFNPVNYMEMDSKERKEYAASYFMKMGFRPTDSMFVFWRLRSVFPEGVKLVDGFKYVYENVEKGESCLNLMLGLYLSDYSQKNVLVDNSQGSKAGEGSTSYVYTKAIENGDNKN